MSGLRSRFVDAAFIAALGILALTGFAKTYAGPRYLVVGAVGLALGLVVALASGRARASTTVAIGMVAFVLVGGAVALPETMTGAVIPTKQTFTELVLGAVKGWWELLTTQPPVPDSGRLLVVPLVLGFATGLAGLLAARARWSLAPVVPVVALVAAVILLGTTGSQPPMGYAAAFVALVLIWGAVRYRRSLPDVQTADSWQRALLAPAVLVLVAAVVTAGSDLFAPQSPPEDRYVLREHVTPPFDPSEYPSPLSGFRKFEKREREAVLFTVTGLPAGSRIRMATMDAYDGVVWNVVNGDGGPADGSGVFRRVGARVEAPRDGLSAQVRVIVGAYREIWMPTAGELTSVDFEGGRSANLFESFRYNTATGIGVVPVGLTEGDSYTMSVVIPSYPEPNALAGQAFGSVTLPELRGVPDEIDTVASDWVGDGGGSYTQLETLVDTLKKGAFSDGDVESGVQSPPGHGAKRIRDFLAGQQLVGDAEQYAATLALMSRALGMPARVVLGVVPPEGFDGKVTGAMVSAWVEVNFAGAGWVPFDPTPPVESKPKKQQIKPQPDPQGQVLEPPVLQAQPPAVVPPPQAQEPTEDVNCLLAWFCFNSLPEWLQWVLTYVAAPIALFALGLLTIVLLKVRRRRRRRRVGPSATRVAGAWHELLDRLADHGIRTSAYDTRGDVAVRYGNDVTLGLAGMADAAIFGPGDPSEAEVRDVWACLPLAVGEVVGRRSRWKRFLAAINPITLRPRSFRPARARAS